MPPKEATQVVILWYKLSCFRCQVSLAMLFFTHVEDNLKLFQTRFKPDKSPRLSLRTWFEHDQWCVIELQAKLLNYFLGSNKSNINQSEGLTPIYICVCICICIKMCAHMVRRRPKALISRLSSQSWSLLLFSPCCSSALLYLFSVYPW